MESVSYTHLNLVFDEISFEMGFNGEKYELILTPEGDKVKLFELVYFQKHAPKEVLEQWNILVGRQPLQNIGLRTDDGWDISGEDVQIWLEEQGENSFAISAYCEKLLPMLREEMCIRDRPASQPDAVPRKKRHSLWRGTW